MEYRTARGLVDDLRARRVSAIELLDEAIGRIERLDGALNAVVVRDFDRARGAARAADEALARGERRPLLGLPITVKEAFNVAGLPTTWGLPGTERIPVTEDAVAVARLKAAGAVLIGKTNAPTLLADWQCANPVYGVTRNPWDLGRTPGGSSGGGAAALAAGFVALEFGTDLSASLRAPAAFCGVYAHKPSYGPVPTRGFAPPGASTRGPALDLAVVGPMARSAGDLVLALEATAGPDGPDAVGYRLGLPAPRHTRLRDHRVLVLDTHPAVATAPSIQAALGGVADRLAKAGCRVGRGSPHLPDLTEILATFVELLLSIFSAEASDEEHAHARAAADHAPGGLDPVQAAGLRGPALSHRDWIRADRRRAAIAWQWTQLFQDWDVVLCPAMSTHALSLNDPTRPSGPIEVEGVRLAYEQQPTWATLATLTGQPATVAPIGVDPAGLPIAAQVIGPFLEDRTTLAFAALMEEVFGGFVAPPAWT